MPRSKRQRLRRHTDFTELDGWLDCHLTYGYVYVPTEIFKSLDDMKSAWRIHRGRIMESFIKETPARRPFAWWMIEGVPRYMPTMEHRINYWIRKPTAFYDECFERAGMPSESETLRQLGELSAGEIRILSEREE